MKKFGTYTSRRNEKETATVFEKIGHGEGMMVYFWDHMGVPSVLKKIDFDKQYPQAVQNDS